MNDENAYCVLDSELSVELGIRSEFYFPFLLVHTHYHLVAPFTFA